MSAYGNPEAHSGGGELAFMGAMLGMTFMEHWMGAGKSFIDSEQIWSKITVASPKGQALVKSAVRRQLVSSGAADVLGITARAPIDIRSTIGSLIAEGKQIPNPYHYKNFIKGGRVAKAGFFEKMWPSTMVGRESLAKRVAFRSWRGKVFQEAFSKSMAAEGVGAGFGAARKAITTEMSRIGMKATSFEVAKLLGSGVARVGSIALNTYFIADAVTSLASFGWQTMIQLGKPKDVTPRYYDSPFNATMRQAGLQAIHESRMQTRSAFAREASFMHR